MTRRRGPGGRQGPADDRARRTTGPGGRQGPADDRARRKWLALDRLIAAIPVISRNLDPSDRQHTRVLDAILAGDAAAARAVREMTARAVREEHCDATAELLRGLFR